MYSYTQARHACCHFEFLYNYILLVDYPTKCRANVFEGFLLLVKLDLAKLSMEKPKLTKINLRKKLFPPSVFVQVF